MPGNESTPMLTTPITSIGVPPNISTPTLTTPIYHSSTVQELQELLVDDKFAFVVECGFLKPATSVVMGDIADIVHAVFLEYVSARSH